mmetsp:Transcript_20843/g.27009  ORF Transcript_20843/g.27009 Transcript_20843/m.27009 type:complete len:264 (-) Transcript_20843:417-1208(-)
MQERDEAAVCTAVHAFEASEPSEMSLKEGERCLIMQEDNTIDNGWVLADSLDRPGRHGYVPRGYLSINEKLHEINLLLEDDDTADGGEEDEIQIRSHGGGITPSLALTTTAESQGVSPMMELISVDSQLSPQREDDASFGSTEQQISIGNAEKNFSNAALAVSAANKLAKEKVAIFVLYDNNGSTQKVCFRARFERLKNGLTNKAKDQIIRRFFQKRPDLQDRPLAHFCATTDSSLITHERQRTHYRTGTILLEVKLKDHLLD